MKYIRKKKYSIHKRYTTIISVIFLLLLFIGIGYANLNTDLFISGIINISSFKNKNYAYNLLPNLLEEGNSCIMKYDGQVTDQVGQTVTATKVYFDKCLDKRNVIFGNYCWQVIRTTETGGLKIVYNGEPVDNKCESSRTDHKGIVQNSYDIIQDISSNYLYSTTFDYNENSNEFTLIDSFSETWSDSTYDNLIGKFTCLNNTGTCTTIYNINGYETNTSAALSSYVLYDTNYSLIGRGAFNAKNSGPAAVGYMFNTVYKSYNKDVSTITGNIKFSSTFTYDSSTNTYSLSGTTNIVNDWAQSYGLLNKTRYTCWNSSGDCQTISFLSYYDDELTINFDFEGGKSPLDILDEMLWNSNVNRYNSSAKSIIDSWYAKNLNSKTSALEDIVHCNNRAITNYGSWDPNGETTAGNYYIQFKNFNQTNDLSCEKVTDQFTMSNNLAKLTYPVAMIQNEEINNLNNNSLTSSGYYWWSLSPAGYGYSGSYNRYINTDGSPSSYTVEDIFGLRPVISLLPTNKILSGDGSETNPWIIE